MKGNLIIELLKLGIFSSEKVSEEEYRTFSKIDERNEYIITYNGANGSEQYEKVDKHGLTDSEILMLLEIKKLKSIKAIMYMTGFFFSLAIIYIVLLILGLI